MLVEGKADCVPSIAAITRCGKEGGPATHLIDYQPTFALIATLWLANGDNLLMNSTKRIALGAGCDVP